MSPIGLCQSFNRFCMRVHSLSQYTGNEDGWICSRNPASHTGEHQLASCNNAAYCKGKYINGKVNGENIGSRTSLVEMYHSTAMV